MEACPLDGRCSECGLEFAWGEVCNETRRKLRGVVEHEPSGRMGLRVYAAAWWTWGWTVLPHRFWRRVRMYHPASPGRWLVWLLTVLLTMHVLTAGMTAVGYAAHQSVMTTARLGRPDPGLHLAARFLSELAAPIAGVELLRLNPIGGFTFSLPRYSEIRWFQDGVAATLAAGLAGSVTFAVVFALLPDTRRVSKVRLVHVGRAFVYGLGWLVLLGMIPLLR